MELFEKVYSSYYQVVRHILAEASTQPVTQNRMNELSMQYGFLESSLAIIPKLLNGQWPLLRETTPSASPKTRSYHSVLTHPQILQPGALPLTTLQKSWLKALLSDPRIRLFLTPEAFSQANQWLHDITPLFHPKDFTYFDQYRDGDDYQSPSYQEHFQTILSALETPSLLIIDYENRHQKPQTLTVFPCQLQYSSKDDKFRLCCLRHTSQRLCQQFILNLSRIKTCRPIPPASAFAPTIPDSLPSLRFHLTTPAKDPVVLQISGERNSLERCMLHFANYEKHTHYDEESQTWICSIYYDLADETELLIEILSFGPVIRVLSPESFLSQLRTRIQHQHDLLYRPLSES